jgi:hypothetical protein
MKNMQPWTKIVLSFCSSFFFFQAISAQNALEKGFYLSQPDSARVEGYFYLGEYVFGSIDFHQNDKSDKYKVLRPEQVIQISTDQGVVFFPYTTNTAEGPKSIFIKQVISAGANLYEGKIDKKSIYFISSEANPAITKINQTSPPAFLTAYLGEKCGPRNPVRYDKAALVGVLTNYARCMGYQVAKPEKKPFLLNIALGIRGTYFNQTPSTSGYYSFPFEPVTGGMLGGDIKIGLLKNVYLRTGFTRTQITMQAAEAVRLGYVYLGWPFEFSGPFRYSYQTSEFPLDLVWYFNKNKKFSPTFSGGITYIYASDPVIDQDLTGPVEFRPNFYSFTKEDVQNSFNGSILATVGNPRRFWQFRAGFIYRIHKRFHLELTARYMKRQELFYNTKVKPPGGYVFVTHQSWFDYSLAVYLPLVIDKPIR